MTVFENFHIPLVTLPPFAGVLAAQWMWLRRRASRGGRAEEERSSACRREAMRAIQEALLATERAQRSREEFVALMSHELRTPLNAVIGFSRVLEANRAGNQRPEDIQLLRRVRAGGEHLLRLFEDVLEQVRIARGNLEMAVTDTDVAVVARRVVARNAPAAAMKGLRLSSRLPWTPALAALDAGRFELVLDHLVENAIKFTADGTVRVELFIHPGDGRPVRMEVADTGIGIPAERQEQIFLPFEQADGGVHRPHDVAGLGLPLARQLCNAMGCALTVHSVPGEGSRFVIHFPGGMLTA